MTTLSTPLAASGLGSHYVPVCSRLINGQQAAAWLSQEMEDSNWDDFLEATPLGHFQQTSLWARAKGIDGWRPLRMILTLDGQITGGFQILTRHTRFGLIGYVSKGPVVIKEEDALLDFMMELVVSTVKANHLKALILQPPDQSTIDDSILTRHQFLPNHLVDVVSATLIVDTACSLDAIMSRMRRTTMLELKQSQKRGIKIREGGEQDIKTFFRLMTTTCRRQQTSPSPATESAMLEIWKAFHPTGRIRLSVAEYETESVAAAVCLCFGERVTFWKKGWSGEHRERHPNQLVMFDAIRWSQSQGYRLFDCAGMNHGTAVNLLSGKPLSETQKKARDFFLLGYGGTPTLLPESKVYISNPALRFMYRSAMRFMWSRALAKHLVGNRI
jgi:lipid II:glycine glycyltransferase (peptidoglycan interpeptide bridge formation enzyme)